MVNKRGQAATEFLMTYGWAILVVIVAVAALAYFGVMQPDKYLPEKCLLEPGYQCADYKVTPSQIDLIVKNAAGFDIDINSIKVGSCENSNIDEKLSSDSQKQFTLTGCSNGEIGSQYKGKIEIGYSRSTTNLTKTMNGDIITKIQQ